jgi:hypothetical protein
MKKDEKQEGDVSDGAFSYGAMIVKELGNPKRAKTLHALNHRILRCEKLIREHSEKLTPKCYELIEDYKKEVLIQENVLITEVKVMGLKQIKLPPKQYAMQRMELLDKHQDRHKNILQGITKNLTDGSFEKIESELQQQESTKQITQPQPIKRDTIFTPSWSYVPKISPPVISINGVGFLTIENIAVIVATRGYGKSSICESILSNLLNKNCDCLGFEVGDGVQRAVFLDMERTDYDVWNSWRRMITRAEIKQGDETINDKVLFKGLRKTRQVNEKMKEIEKIIIEFKPQLVMLDTAKSFVPSINDEIKVKQLAEWMEHIAVEYQCAILTTLHPNKQKDTKTEETIGGGWLGRVLEEVCEGVLQVTKDVDEIRTVTSVKERNTAKQRTAFKFCEEKRMMVSCEKVFKTSGRPKNLPLIEEIETEEIQKMRKTIGYKQYKYKLFTETLKSYIEEELPHLKSTDEKVRKFILELIKLRFVKKTGTQPLTTYEFREDENFGTGKQKQIML